MGTTSQDGGGNTLQVPFTRDEMVRAYAQVMPIGEAEEFIRSLYEPPPGTTGVNLMDGTLLLVAALSEEVAERVVRYRPRLVGLVQRVRADPEGFLREWKDPEDP